MLARVLTILTFLLGTISSSQSYGLTAPTETRASTNAPLVLIDEVSGSYCTAFPISADGYLMTAVHCMKRCLDEQQKKTKSAPELNSEIQCSGYALPDLKTDRVKIVARGSILQQKKIVSRFGDYAILKIETSKPLSCLALSESPIAAGEMLKVVGYPMPKTSGEKPKLSSTSGTLYASPEQSRYYKSRKSIEAKTEISDQYALKDGVLYSNVHHSAGQSGGPVVDKNGKVVGIVSGFTVTRAGRDIVHEMVAGSTSKILATLPQSLSNQLLEKSRGCETRL